MLVHPSSAEPLRVLGLDPGTSKMGVALIEWDIPLTVFRVASAFTMQATDRASAYRSINELHGARCARIQQHGDELYKVLCHTQPHVVIAESPFMGRFAQSFGALTEAVYEIRTTLQQFDPHIPLYTVDPPSAKRSAGVKLRKGMDKDDVRNALLARRDLSWQVDPQYLDEHSIDAVAVGLHYLVQLA